MKLLRDADAYRCAVRDFVDGRCDAGTFLPRFRHLWRSDDADCVLDALSTSAFESDSNKLYGLLDGLHALCETYSDALHRDGAYRVSEEQFRKEVECLARHSVLLPMVDPTTPASPT